MADYIRRYERVARELKTAGRGEIAEEVRGWNLLGQAKLAELEEQVVVGARHTHKGYDHIKGELIGYLGKNERRKLQVGWSNKKGEPLNGK